jgi:hypothetical protein
MPLPEPVNRCILAMEGKDGKVFVTYEQASGERFTICVTDDGSFDEFKVKGPASLEEKA